VTTRPSRIIDAGGKQTGGLLTSMRIASYENWSCHNKLIIMALSKKINKSII